ncbi:trigger factor [Patescibacteria group bacterium]
MKVEKKDLDKSQVELTITITPEEFNEFSNRAAANLAKDMKVEGFRPGKVPREIVEKNVGPEKLFEEAVRVAVPDTLVKAFADENIEAIGQPEIIPQKVAIGNEFVYKAKVAILPKIELPDYSDIKVERKKVDIADKDLEKVLEDLQKSRSKAVTVKRAAKKGDRVEVDFEAKLNKVTIEGGKSENHPVLIGEKKFVPGFEEKLEGMKADEEKDFAVIFPKDYYKKDLANREVDFHVKVKAVQEVELPKIDDEFAKSLGKFADVKALKAQIKKNMQHEKEHKEENKLEMEIIHKIADKIDFNLPDVLIKSEQKKIVDEMEQSMAQQGVKFQEYLDSIKKSREQLENDQSETAEKRVKASLVLRAVADKEKIEISAQDIEDEIAKIKKAHTDMYKGKAQQDFEDPKYKDYLRSLMLNRKVFGKLKEQCIKE